MKRLIPLLFLLGCSMSGHPVTMDAFYSVDTSATEAQVVAALGKPYTVNKLGDGSIEYEYLERIKIGSRYAETRRYILVMRDGVVVSKRVQRGVPAPWKFDSYEMQTTQNDDSAPSE